MCYNRQAGKGGAAMKDSEPPSDFFGALGNAVTVGQFVAALAVFGISCYFNVSPGTSITLGIATFVILILLLWAYRRFLRKSLQRWKRALEARLLALVNGLLCPKNSYECRNKVAEYTYLSREEMALQVTYEVKFISGTHRSITDRLKWSAGLADQISSVVPGQEITPLGEEEKDDILLQLGYQNFKIKLSNNPLSREDSPVSTGYRCDGLYDPEHKALTCFVTGVPQKINRLTLRVRFDMSLKVSNIRKLKYARYLDSIPYDITRCKPEIDEAREFQYVEFTIKHPVPGGKYAIDWEFQS